MNLTIKSCVVFVALSLTNLHAWSAAGRVQFATGEVVVAGADGTSKPLSKGAEFNSGDTIQTLSGRAQLRFTDGGFVSLQPNTQFKVDEYAYEGNAAAEGKNFFSLLKGGMRAITGLVGKSNKEAYRVNTPVATIGIRGTEYLAEYDVKLLVKVGDGAVYITNLGGDIILYPGQVGEVTGDTVKPQYSTEEPSVNAAAPSGASPDEVQEQAKSENENLAVFSTGELSNEDGNPCVVEGGCAAAVDLGIVQETPTAAGEFSGLIFDAVYDDNSPTSAAQAIFNAALIKVDASGNLIGGEGFDFDIQQFVNFTYSGQTLDKGSIGGGGNGAFNPTANKGISWARLSGGEFTKKDAQGNILGTELISNEHVIFGGITDANDPVFSGPSATYTYAGGTSPTDAAGNLGNINSATLSVNFVASTIDLNMALTMNSGPGAGSYSVTANGGVGAPYFAVTSSSVTGPGCSSCNLDAVGFFSGSSAIRAGISYVISGSSASGDIAGVAAFVKDGGGGGPL